jgi:hypothetical protein
MEEIGYAVCSCPFLPAVVLGGLSILTAGNDAHCKALEWLTAMCSHVPGKGEQMVRYYGHYSNVSGGKRKHEDQDELIPSILETDGSPKEY